MTPTWCRRILGLVTQREDRRWREDPRRWREDPRRWWGPYREGSPGAGRAVAGFHSPTGPPLRPGE
jgi:hypothetical protein